MVVCLCVVFLVELARLLTNGAFFVLDAFRTVLRQQRFDSRLEMVRWLCVQIDPLGCLFGVDANAVLSGGW